MQALITPKFIGHEIIYRERFILENDAHDTGVLFIVESGSFALEMDDRKVIAGDNDLVFFHPDIFFKRKIIMPITIHYIQFETSHDSVQIPIGKISLTDIPRLKSTITLLRNLSKSIDKNSKVLYQHILDDLIYQCYFETNYQNSDENERTDDIILKQAIEYFKNNMHSKININELSKKIGITHSGLIWKFKREIGITPVDYLTIMRINKAKHLLMDTGLPITRIAEMCGYENSFYFSNAFKKNTQQSPSEYRMSYRL